MIAVSDMEMRAAFDVEDVVVSSFWVELRAQLRNPVEL